VPDEGQQLLDRKRELIEQGVDPREAGRRAFEESFGATGTPQEPTAAPRPRREAEFEAKALERQFINPQQRELAEGDAILARQQELVDEGVDRREAGKQAVEEVQAITGTAPEPDPPGLGPAPGLLGGLGEAAESTVRALRARKLGPDPRVGLIKEAQAAAQRRLRGGGAFESVARGVLPEETASDILGATPEESKAEQENVAGLRAQTLSGLLPLLDTGPGRLLTAPARERVGQALGEFAEETLPAGEDDIRFRDKGVELETPAMASLAAFDLIPDALQEGAFRLPTPVVTKDGKPDRFPVRSLGEDLVSRISEGQAPGQALQGAVDGLGLDAVPLEELLLNTTPEQRGLLPDSALGDRGPILKWWLRSMHKLEQRKTLGNDFDAASQVLVEDLGIEDEQAKKVARWLGWGVGEAGHTFAPWEMVLSPAARGAKALKAVKELPDFVDKARLLGRALAGVPLPEAKATVDALRARVAAGEDVYDLISQLPDSQRSLVRQMMNEDGIPLQRPAPPPAPEPPGVPFAEGAPSPTIGPLDRAQETHAKVGQALEGVRPRVPFAIRQQAADALEQLETQARSAVKASKDALEEAWDKKILEIQARRDQLLDDAGFTGKRVATMEEANRKAHLVQQARKGEKADVGIAAVGGKVPHGGFKELRWKGLADPGNPARAGYRLLSDDGVTHTVGTLEEAAKAMAARQNPTDYVQWGDYRDVLHWRGLHTKDPTALAKALARRRDDAKPLGQMVSNRYFSSPAEKAAGDAFSRTSPRGIIPPERLDAFGLGHKPKVRKPRGKGGKSKKPATPDAAAPDATTPKPDVEGAPPAPPVEPFTEVGGTIGLNPTENAVRRFFRGMLGDKAPPGTIEGLDDVQSGILDIVESVTRAELRSRFHGAELVQPLAGVIVTKAEKRVIDRTMEASRKQAGFNPHDVPSHDIPDDIADAARRFTARHGVDLPSGELTTDMISDATAQVIKKLAGRSADKRLAIDQTWDTSQKLLDATLKAGATPGKLMQDGASIGGVRGAAFGLTDARIRQLPPALRTEVDGALRSLRQVGRELLSDIQRVERGSKVRGVEALHEVLKEYRPVSEQEIALLETLKTVELTKDSDVFAFRNMLNTHVADDLDLPGMWGNDPVQVKAAIGDYAIKRSKEIEALGRRVLKAALPDDMFDKMGRIDLVENLDSAQLQGVWQDFVATGDFEIDAIAEALQDVYHKKIKVKDTPNAMVALGLHMKSDEILDGVLKKAAELELGTVDDEVITAMRQMQNGIKPSGPLGKVAKARNILRRSGLESDLPDDIFTTQGGVFMPAGLAEEIVRAQRAGINVRPADFKNRAAHFLYRNYKDGLTVWNPAFHVGNAMGVPFMALQTMGGKDALRAASKLVTHPDWTFNMARRLSGVPAYGRPGLASKVFRTKDGRMYSPAEMERAMRRLGVAETFQSALNARDLAEDLQRSSGMWNALSRKVSGARDAIAGSSEFLERTFRISVFLDNVEQGSDFEQAALRAREALYDYGTLTDFDRQMAKKGLVFWAFHRKNMDAFLRQVVDNPHRLGMQIRFATTQRPNETDIQKSRLSNNDLGRLVLDPLIEPAGTAAGLETKPNGREYAFATTSTLTPIEGFLLTRLAWAPVLAALQGGVGAGLKEGSESAKELGGQSNPLTQAAANVAFDVDLGTGFRSTTPRSNRVPSWMMEYPVISQAMEATFEPEMVTPSPSKLATQGDFDVGLTPKFWSVPERNQKAWQAFQSLGPNRILTQTIPEILDVTESVASGEPPEEGRFIALLQALGVHARPVPSTTEQLIKQRSESAQPLNKLTREAERELQ